MISLNTIYLTYKLNHSTFKVKDLQQVPQHFLEKNPNSSSWPINKVLLVVPSASSLTGHSPLHSLASFLFVEHTKSYPHPGLCTCGILSTYLSVLSPDITSLGAFTGHHLEKQSPFPSFYLLELSQSHG